DLGGDARRFNWTGGTLNVTQSLTIGPGEPFGDSFTFAAPATSSAGRILNISGTAIVSAGGTINLIGGTFTAGTLDLGRHPERLNWTAGTLNLTSSNLVI